MKGLERHWYQSDLTAFSLWPISWLYCGVATLRALWQKRTRKRLLVRLPVIVVGNISVGGTGKTPMVVWLASFLKAYGYTPGIVTRGYKGKATVWPQRVMHYSRADVVGDEPLLIAQRTGCPVYAGPDRVADINLMQAENPDVDIIISDDGLQHYKMPRDVEIVMIDGLRRFGNQLCLPAGPLRESLSRLDSADFQVVTEAQAEDFNGYSMRLDGKELVNLRNPDIKKLVSDYIGKKVNAVAGIGNPQRFFNKLTQFGMHVEPHAFPDHHSFQPQDFRFNENLPVIMTEKDAVKCKHLALDHYWYLPVKARISHDFANALTKRLREKTGG